MATASSPSLLASARTSSSLKRFLPSPCSLPRPDPLLRLCAGSVKQWREFEDEAGAVKEWQEFEDAVRSKDLARALRFLQSVEPEAGTAATQVAVPVQPGRDWEVLDACIDADDMRLVGRAYQFLSDRGVLANFGKCKSIVLEGPRGDTSSSKGDDRVGSCKACTNEVGSVGKFSVCSHWISRRCVLSTNSRD